MLTESAPSATAPNGSTLTRRSRPCPSIAGSLIMVDVILASDSRTDLVGTSKPPQISLTSKPVSLHRRMLSLLHGRVSPRKTASCHIDHQAYHEGHAEPGSDVVRACVSGRNLRVFYVLAALSMYAEHLFCLVGVLVRSLFARSPARPPSTLAHRDRTRPPHHQLPSYCSSRVVSHPPMLSIRLQRPSLRIPPPSNSHRITAAANISYHISVSCRPSAGVTASWPRLHLRPSPALCYARAEE
ncbi:hypothetical protein EXIGLDRAFT_96308 [Exidia glandulosa HHB12029]|uniref:Uncharacterized protein n=1 Tax=Exidia glandulosa HHB12029 TaxID=1314781 RepID=A0A165H4D0_EXIGL|nr:hypothetical protein EXIGLDRAFT_96308 [Exidia glandulosa HHB12029]